ncbi:MAG: ArsA family ATPase [Dehalococcoidia bacterium]|nr:ArsA family ATPase [Dehalococcoidia bacterium]
MKDIIMFCGKGGVGKTTCAAATALHYAAEGKETLIISTDFTPSLRDIFELESGEKLVRVVEGLYLAEIGAEEVKELWDKKFGAEVYEVFSAVVDIDYEEFVAFVTTILPGIRDEFMVDYLRELSESGEYEKIVWDTAPAGQTLGLLRMPSLVNQHLKPAPRIYSRLKASRRMKRSVLEVIKGWEELSNRDMEFLKKGVEFTLVTIAEALAVRQLDSIFHEFQSYGLNINHIIINQVIEKPDSAFLHSKARMQQGYISEIASRYGNEQRILPLFPYEIKGTERLKEVERVLFGDG